MSTLKAINLQHPTASTANITLSNTGGIALNGSVSGGGMDLITPTSVVGGTFSGGAISFSSITGISLNGCFTSSYANYQIVFTGTSVSTTGLFFRGRVAGVDDTSANYQNQRFTVSSTTITGTRGASSTSGDIGTARTTTKTFYLNFSSPNINNPKTLISVSNDYGSGNVIEPIFDSIAVGIPLTTQYDGFSILSSNAMTGTLRVYGLRNS